MSKFNVGDRVALYDGCVRFTGEVREITDIGQLMVRVDTAPGNSHIRWALPKQCRHLKKDGRRRLWVHPDELGIAVSVSASAYPGGDNWIQFVEVSRKVKR